MRDVDDRALLPLLGRLTLEEKVRLLTGRDSWSLHPLPHIGLRSIVFSDGPVGVRGTVWDERSPSVNFPSPTAVAASWDTAVARRVGAGLGQEARRKGVDVVLAPTINLQRSPYGGRHFEAFSEDPLLTAEVATAYVRGVQSHGVGATVKHYVANDSETDRFIVDVRVSDRTLRELYLLAFEQPVIAGPSWLVMSSYNSINGATASENELLTTPLNDEWSFDGVVVSDWTAVRSVNSARHPQDLAMPGPGGAWGQTLIDAVQSGEVDERHVDRKVLRILRLAARVGALEGVAGHVEPGPIEDLHAVARDAAVAGSVLLSNRSLLPLRQPTSIAVIGEGAWAARTQGGGSATVIPASVMSPLEGIRERWPDADVRWALGAVTEAGLSDLTSGSFTTGEGEPGMTVRYLDASGAELGRESRTASSLVWFGGESAALTATVIEMGFRYALTDVADRVSIGLAGLADFEVIADGAVVTTGSLRTRPGDDPATAVLNPPSGRVEIPVSGPSVDLTVRFMPVKGEIPDAMALRIGIPPVDAGPESLIIDAAELAGWAEVAVVVVSTSAEVESEGFDRDSLRLPGRQDDLVRAVAAANPRTVVIVNAGAPVLLPWRDDVAAVLAAWFPGQEFGSALAAVLSGDAEPGGRLPVSWPATEADVPISTVRPTDGRLDYGEGVHIGYRAWLRGPAEPAYPFGHGLGYTTWHVTHVEAPATIVAPEEISVLVSLENLSERLGKTVIQVYLERVSPSTVDRPVRWLAGFAPVTADPARPVTVEVPVSWRRFAHWDTAWQLEPGDYRLCVGFSSSDLRTQSIISVPPPA